MDCENITLPMWQFESFKDSSDRMELLCEGRRRGLDFHNAWVDVILGIDMGAEENPTDNWWDNIPDSSEPEPPRKPAIMVEKIEDPEEDDTCPDCGAHLDPGEHCDCVEHTQHKNMFQRNKDNYEREERAGGKDRCQHYMN